jgi:hypothetical protein
MIPFFPGFLTCLTAFFRSRCSLSLEIIALCLQLGKLKRKNPHPLLQIQDRIFWIVLRRFWSAWSNVLVIVKPETVVAWHRAGFRLFWQIRSRGNKGRPKTDAALRRPNKRMASENPPWGAPRIHGELLKLGFDISEHTVFSLYPVLVPSRTRQGNSGLPACAITARSSQLWISYRLSVLLFSEKWGRIYSFPFFLPYLTLLAYVFP